ncbi:conjugal transfer ATPase TcpF [Agathobaculum desmolans]|uniref:conjugal transfer ATPase TcpF n=1 Tax=Agathobaculum desmolans TaxID=39484 RepID=UPI0004E13D47|nr:ATP-binding protein [Agathobaculum desmolans]
MQYPMKYIENNLVWNHDGECFAYYELIPYNYSFLSVEQKQAVHDAFRQLIAQNRDGKIHALQISTESSIRAAQERSKAHASGKLREAALRRINGQTDALVSMIGENQVDYRFYIGFKLLLNEQESGNIGWQAANIFSGFLRDVNHNLMGDFASMPNDEILRYQKMEKLLESKISRRFKVRRLDQNDFGYLLEHLYGQSGVAYEDYAFHLPKKKLKGETLVKRYDLIKPTRCLLEEHGRYLHISHDDSEVYSAYFTISDVVGELDFPSSEIFYYQQQQFTFPVDTSMNVEIIANKKALSTVRNKKKELKDLDNHAWESGDETSTSVAEALESVNELETELGQSKEAMYKLSYVVRVTAPDAEELKRRCNAVRDFYDDMNVKLVRPVGDMIGLHHEFIPASRRYMNDYIQYVTSDFLAGLGFGAAQMLGEKDGIYIGYGVDTGRNVYLQPALASQGVKGSVTNALSAAFLGSLGGGKSFANNLLVYYAVLNGARALIVDPKAERGNWKRDLPEIADEINIVNLTSDEQNKGMLDPYVIMRRPKDAESLAIDILTFLTGISSRDGERFPILRRAVRTVTNSKRRGLLCVIDELRKEGSPLAVSIADHIESFTDYDFAHLLFSNGNIKKSISLEKQLNIVQVADLVLPDKGTSFEEYTTMELLSVAMLIVISTFALDFIHMDRSVFKIVDLDEAWSFLNVAQGKMLANKLVRAGRAMNAAVYFVTQNAADLADESLKNNIGLKFAFRSTDTVEIKKTLTFFGLDPEDEGNQKRLRGLENGQCLMQDLYGHVGVVQFHPVFADLFRGFDTRPPLKAEV